jgi:predicted RNase H-like HicB family nuclease
MPAGQEGAARRRREERRRELSAAEYTYEASWSEEERTFIARVREFPALEARADSRGAALRALKSVVYAVAKDLADFGAESTEPPPPDTR